MSNYFQVCATYVQASPALRQSYELEKDKDAIGHEAARGQFPHQAGIVMDNTDFCGGSLISKNWVLTAGQCARRFSRWTVMLGAHKISDANEPGRVTLSTKRAIVHEEFDEATYDSDVAVIQLPQDVQFSGKFLRFADVPCLSVDLMYRYCRQRKSCNP